MPEGLSIKPQDNLGQKEPTPTLVFIGRLKKHKLPHGQSVLLLLLFQFYSRTRLMHSSISDHLHFSFFLSFKAFKKHNTVYMTLTFS
jgi:hypothetical protein